jgi:lysozyme
MTLRTTQNGLDLIRAFEGEKLKAYRCPAGVWTIGVGHTSAAGAPKVTEGMVITKAESAEIFRRDIDTFEDAVERLLAKAKVNVVEPCEFDAMVSLAFNIGLGAFKGSTVLARYLRGDKAGAAAAFAWWNKVKGVAVAGLTRRRKAETALFRGETSVALAKALDFNEPMPQRVDRPKPPKSMAASKTGNAAVTVGGVGVGLAIEGVRGAVEQSRVIRDTAQSAGEVFGLSGSTAILIGAGVVVAGLAVFIWWDRRRRLHEDMA